MSEHCSKCVNGWIAIHDNAFEMCDCLLGQAMRRPQRLIVHSRPQPDPVEEAFQWFKSKYEGKVT